MINRDSQTDAVYHSASLRFPLQGEAVALADWRVITHGVAVIGTQALEAETQGFQVIRDFVIARLCNPVELTGTGSTRRAPRAEIQLNSAANLPMKAMQASICAISIYSSG